jgi:hypothetical protein
MMELHIDLVQFPNEAARQFAITGEAVYYPVNFFLKDPAARFWEASSGRSGESGCT